METEINLILPQIPRTQNCGIITTLVSSFIRLAYEGICSFLQYKQNKGLHKYITLYRELITQLHIYAASIRIFAKGYLPILLITPSKLREILSDVKTVIRKTNPDYDLVIHTLHLYYNMQFVTFGINIDKNLIIQFPLFIQPYTQQPLILYQIETVPVQ